MSESQPGIDYSHPHRERGLCALYGPRGRPCLRTIYHGGRHRDGEMGDADTGWWEEA